MKSLKGDFYNGDQTSWLLNYFSLLLTWATSSLCSNNLGTRKSQTLGSSSTRAPPLETNSSIIFYVFGAAANCQRKCNARSPQRGGEEFRKRAECKGSYARSNKTCGIYAGIYTSCICSKIFETCVYWLLFKLEAESKNVTNTINNSARDSSVKIHTIIYRREALHFN